MMSEKIDTKYFVYSNIQYDNVQTLHTVCIHIEEISPKTYNA